MLAARALHTARWCATHAPTTSSRFASSARANDARATTLCAPRGRDARRAGPGRRRERRGRDARRWNDARGFARDARGDDEDEDDEEADDASGSFDESAPRDWAGKVRWMPVMDVRRETEESPTLAEGELVLPMFPLGSHVYLPDTEHVLNIFEPRYRSMYNEILFNGSRRFVVPMCAPNEPGKFASVAAVFYLDDLKEVSEQTNDQVKFVCSHTVIERVRVVRSLNDRVWGDRSSFLKVVTEKFEDCDLDDDFTNKETALEERFRALIDMQEKVDEPIRFTKDVELAAPISAKRGKMGFWRLVNLWQSLLQSRVTHRENELQAGIQKMLRKFLEDSGVDLSDGRQLQLSFESIPADIRAEIQRMNEQYGEERVELLNSAIYPFQYLVQMDSHAERLDYFGELVSEEEKRLAAKNTLRAMFESTE